MQVFRPHKRDTSRRAGSFPCSSTSNGLDLELIFSTLWEAQAEFIAQSKGSVLFHHSIIKIGILTMYLRGGVEGSKDP